MFGFVIDGVDAEQRQPEIGEPLEVAEQLRLISNDRHEDRLAVVARQRDPLEERSELVTHFTFGFEPIGSSTHHATVAHLAPA